MRKSFVIALAAGAFALGGVAYAGGAKTPGQPTVQAPVPMTDMQMQKVAAGSGSNWVDNKNSLYGLSGVRTGYDTGSTGAISGETGILNAAFA